MTLLTVPNRQNPWDALDRWFDFPVGARRGYDPAVQLTATNDGYNLRFEIPGVPPENVSIEAAGRTLTISGKVEDAAEAEGAEFSRALSLPADADPNRAEADYKHGVLYVHVPKKEDARPLQIEVKSQ